MYDDERIRLRTTEVLKGDEYPGLEEDDSPSAGSNCDNVPRTENPLSQTSADYGSMQQEASAAQAGVNAGYESGQPETVQAVREAVNTVYESAPQAVAAGQAVADIDHDSVQPGAVQAVKEAVNEGYENAQSGAAVAGQAVMAAGYGNEVNSASSVNSAVWQNTYYRNDTYGNAGSQGEQYQGTYWQMNPDYRANPYPAGNAKQEPAEKKQKKEKKQRGFFGSVCRVAAIGLVFGFFAGAGFLAVRYGGGLLGVGKDADGSKPVTVSYTDSASVEKDGEQKISTPTEPAAVAIPATESVTTIVTDVSTVAEEVMPSIVSIVNSSTVKYYYYNIPSDSSGSGIIIGSNTDELLLVTNYHVVEENNKLTVTFCDGSEAEALVKGSDASMDLAVIAVQLSDISDSTMNAIRIARMGDSDALKVGEPAIAIGNALGYGQSVTTGVISALNREMDMDNIKGTFIQTDAAINPGNSGGALLNINGEVIGINSSKIGGTKVEGMGYAIPISAARPIIEELMQKTTRTLVPEEERGYLGITGATVTQQEIYLYGYPEGAYVVNVNDGSAADRAGMQRGDYITGFDGERITSMEGLQRILMYYREGDTVNVQVLRPNGDDYDELTLQLTLGDKSDLGRSN